jgi:hypothetical protein
MTFKAPLLAAAALALGLSACASDYSYNPYGTSYGYNSGYRAGYARSDYREYRRWPSTYYNGRYYYQEPSRKCWYAPPDRDDNPPGPRGGPGTNWENPPGPAGGPGASPDRNMCR